MSENNMNLATNMITLTSSLSTLTPDLSLSKPRRATSTGTISSNNTSTPIMINPTNSDTNMNTKSTLLPQSNSFPSDLSFQLSSSAPSDLPSFIPARKFNNSKIRRRASPSPLPISSSANSIDVLVDGRHYQWYFAIGSMINPTSLSLRSVHPYPTHSHPAILRGFRIAFHGMNGMADIEQVLSQEDENESSMTSEAKEQRRAFYGEFENHFHGMLHLVNDEQMAVLDRIEATYVQRIVDVELYDGRTQRCIVYQMDPSRINLNGPHSLPSERYLDIITRGAEHFGIDRRYINWLKSLPRLPRTKPYLSFPPPTSSTAYTLADVSKCDGQNGRPMCIVVNGKVLEYGGKQSNDTCWSTFEHLRHEFAGKDVTHLMSLLCYEPLYPVAPSIKEMSFEHRCMIEDMFVRRLCCLASFDFTVVGHLIENDCSEEFMTLDSLEDPNLIDNGCDLASAIRKCARLASQSEDESEFGDMLLEFEEEEESDTESYMSDCSSISVMRQSECLPENVTIQIVNISENDELSIKKSAFNESNTRVTMNSNDILYPC